jgi:hypothetical protein
MMDREMTAAEFAEWLKGKYSDVVEVEEIESYPFFNFRERKRGEREINYRRAWEFAMRNGHNLVPKPAVRITVIGEGIYDVERLVPADEPIKSRVEHDLRRAADSRASHELSIETLKRLEKLREMDTLRTL